MTFKVVEQLPDAPARNDFSELAKAVKENPGQWFEIPLDSIHGKTTATKRMAVRLSLASRGIKVATRIREETLYIGSVSGE